jgi:Xaa-Pro aminopeptidase
MWTKEQLRKHQEAARRLLEIKDLVFAYLKKNQSINERQLHQFILKRYKEFGLVTDEDLAIAAFGRNTANVHYFPGKKSRRLMKNSLVMLDLWARLDKPHAPFADITWMGYCGKRIPAKIERVFAIVKQARDQGIKRIKRELAKKKLPGGSTLDKTARDFITRRGFGKRFLHSTGHCLGFNTPHGDGGGLTKHNKHPLLKNLGYTLEPGIYLKNKFGIRSEIDFYIDDKMKLIITTDVQDKIIII